MAGIILAVSFWKTGSDQTESVAAGMVYIHIFLFGTAAGCVQMARTLRPDGKSLNLGFSVGDGV